MIFIVLMNILRFLYDNLFFPMVKNPYTYILMFFWVVVAGLITYAFLYKIAYERMQYSYKKIATEILLSGLYGMLGSMILVSVYLVAFYLTITSDFFVAQRSSFIGLGFVSYKILTGLFLLSSLVVLVNNVTEHMYHFQDPIVCRNYIVLLIFGSVVCYLIYMFLGYV